MLKLFRTYGKWFIVVGVVLLMIGWLIESRLGRAAGGSGNPVIGYYLAALKFRKGDIKQAQFYVRRVNNGEFSTAESLWLGIKVERALKEPMAMRQLGDQLRRRFPDSRELLAYERGTFDE